MPPPFLPYIPRIRRGVHTPSVFPKVLFWIPPSQTGGTNCCCAVVGQHPVRVVSSHPPGISNTLCGYEGGVVIMHMLGRWKVLPDRSCDPPPPLLRN